MEKLLYLNIYNYIYIQPRIRVDAPLSRRQLAVVLNANDGETSCMVALVGSLSHM